MANDFSKFETKSGFKDLRVGALPLWKGVAAVCIRRRRRLVNEAAFEAPPRATRWH